MAFAAVPAVAVETDVRTLAADDNIPGVPLSGFASTFTGTLNATSDAHDVYSVALGVGDTLSVSISAPASTYMDLFLYKPGSSTVANDTGIVYWSDSSPGYVYPFSFDFKVDPEQGYSAGTYYLDAFAGTGSGTYTLTWRIIPEDGNNDIPDAKPLTTTPVSGWATSAWLEAYPGSSNPGAFVDGFDVYSIALAEGDQFTATVATTDSDLSMEMLFYPPHATNVDTDGQVVYTDAWVASSDLIRAAMPDSFSFVVPPGGAGTYYLSAEAWGGNGNYTVAWSKNHNTVVRMYGPSRYETGQAIVRSTSYEATTAIVASGMGYADALSAAGVAGAYGAPLLLTNPTSLSSVVAVQLVEMGVEKVIIIGGTAAVSGAVSSALTSGGFAVERISGADRYATSAACAARARLLAGPTDAFVVRGDGFADALAVSPFAYTQRMPVLLTKPTALPADIEAFIETNDVANVYIAGGTPAVSVGVATTIDGLNGGVTTVKRVAGLDRYATARAVADFGVGKGWNSYVFMGVATGTSFPDALAGGVGCGRMGGVLLLTSPTKLSTPTSAALAANKATIGRVAVFGSATAVSAAVFTAVKNLLP
jgi:putative cell wall-binding protein